MAHFRTEWARKINGILFAGMKDILIPASGGSDAANLAYLNAANVFSVAGNSFSEVLGVAKGLQFPATQVASADANTLDDYEEGTWTPTDASGAGLALTVNAARYVKIGPMVYAAASFAYPVTADVTPAVLGGLPFTAIAGGVPGSASTGFTDSALAVLWRVISSATTAFPSFNTSVQVTNTQISGKTFTLMFTYQAGN